MDHRLIEGLMTAIAPIIKTYVAEANSRAVEPLLTRIAELEARPVLKGDPGKDADPVVIEKMVADAVALIPRPADGKDGKDGIDGKDVDPDIVAELVTKEVALIPRPLDGKDGKDGKDGTDGVNGKDVDAAVVAELVAKEVAQIPRPLDGKDGKDGYDGLDGKDVDPAVVAELVAKEVAQIPHPVDGKDGKDIDPVRVEEMIVAEVGKAVSSIPKPQDGKNVTLDDVRPLIEEAVAQIPIPKDGLDGKDGKDVDPTLVREMIDESVTNSVPKTFVVNEIGMLVAAYANGELVSIGKVRGDDGARGASIMDGSVDEQGALVLRMSDGRHVNVGRVRGDDGKDGVGLPGRNGRDAHEIQILPGLDETKSYVEGICARWRGGIIRAERQTDPVIDGNIKAAGWGVILNGVASEEEHDLDDGRVVERETTYTDGTVFRRSLTKNSIIDRGVWRDGVYQRGDGVSWAGSFFIAQKDTSEKPEISRDWRLAVKRGRDGKDAKHQLSNGQGRR